MKRRQEYGKLVSEGTIDDEEMAEIEEAVDNENEMIGMTVAVVKSMANNAKEAYLQSFHKNLLPIFSMFMPENASPFLQNAGACCLCDIIEALPKCQIAQQYAARFLPLAMKNSMSESIDLRQSSVFGIGVCAQSLGSEGFASRSQDAMRILMSIINAADSRSDDNSAVTENAISSVTKILELMTHRHSGETHPQAFGMLGHWLDWLPLTQDYIEAKVVHAKLCEFLADAKRSGAILGEGNRKLPKVFSVFARVYPDPNLCDEKTRGRMCHIAKALVDQLGQAAAREIMSRLPEEERMVIVRMLQEALGGGF